MAEENPYQHEIDDSTFKILIATDNHIGYLEKDPIRGQDSFKTFEEILQIADHQKVDFVLLGGDLFHHNQPSRSCLYQTMKMLRRHCFGERESKIWIASDQSVNFPDEFCTANYLDENFNVSIPVFSIHGNHDDPSGTGNLCALNLLQVSGLVNYFGASPSVEDVLIHPILMKKGDSKLALYGLGNIREERLHRQWRSGHVKFMRPATDGEDENNSWKDCFNLFVFHQNRARHGPTSHIPEEFLDGFLDLVFWGHEHECRISPDNYERFAVTQPGSSVATSLCEGEAEPKHVGLLTVCGSSFQLQNIRLKTTRPLQFTTVSLARVETLRASDPKGVQVYLEGVVETLIERARVEWGEQQEAEDFSGGQLDSQHTTTNMEMPMPLVRIRVDYSGGFETFNPQQFGQKFIDRVANPKDILKFKRERTLQEIQRQQAMKPTERLKDLSTSIPERLDQLKVEDLVNELLSQNDLFILPETGLEEAVMSLVEKSDKEAIRSFVTKSVSQTRATITTFIPDDIEDFTVDYIKRKSTEAKQHLQTASSHENNNTQSQHSRRTTASGSGSSSRISRNDDAVSPTPLGRGNTRASSNANGNNNNNNANNNSVTGSDDEMQLPRNGKAAMVDSDEDMEIRATPAPMSTRDGSNTKKSRDKASFTKSNQPESVVISDSDKDEEDVYSIAEASEEEEEIYHASSSNNQKGKQPAAATTSARNNKKRVAETSSSSTAIAATTDKRRRVLPSGRALPSRKN